MLAIKKTGEGYYLVSLTGHKVELGRNECHMLKKEIMAILKPHREITINIKGIKSIDNGGFNILHELKNVAERFKCKIRYINVEPEIATKVSGLTEKKVKPQKELEYD